MAINLKQHIFSDVAEFILSQPNLEALANYQIPDDFQVRVDELLEKNRESQLTEVEEEELNHILMISQLVNIIKAKAKLKLNVLV